MRSVFDVIDDMYQVLRTSQLKIAVNGSLYKMQRPDDSTKEDIVINALPIVSGDIDECIVNVNIFVPDLHISIAGKQQTQPDFARMKQLTDLGKLSLEEYSSQTFRYFIDNIGVFREQSINQHYINFRLSYGAFTT